MSYKYSCLDGKSNWKDRCKKNCACGCHSAKDVKKNKHHHATAKKLQYRVGRKFNIKLLSVMS